MGYVNGLSKAWLLTIVAIWSILLLSSASAGSTGHFGADIALDTRDNQECRDIRGVGKHQQCAFAKRYCADDDDGILSYIDFYYCRIPHAQPLGVLVLVLWMIFLFSSLGIVAGDFLAVNLSSIAQNLQISDTLAGVTFLALGNGAPDIFSTIAAMGQSSNNLALGELLGAAAFITSVVCGSMALIRPYHVIRTPLVRDCIFLLATIVFLLYILSDGFLRVWHCITLLSIYMVYIVVVVGWHWWKARRHQGTAPDTTREPDHDGENEALLPRDQAQHPSQGPSNYRRRRSSYATLLSSNDELVSTTPLVTESQGEAGNSWTRILHALTPTYFKQGKFGMLHILAYLIMLPTTTALKITTPRLDEAEAEKETSSDSTKIDNQGNPTMINETADAQWDRWLTATQCFTAPQFILWLIARQLDKTASEMLLPCMICLPFSALLAGLTLLTTSSTQKPRWWRWLSLPGFVVSIAWISALADEIVAVLKILGIISNIPDAIMGMTAFAIGNSIDDWAANISIARRQRPVMALSACFGGPLLNILIGISVSGMIAFAKGSTMSKHGKRIQVIDLHPNRSLFFVAGSAILNITVLLVLMLWTRWRMERSVGYILSGLWIVCTVVNVVLEVRR